eukprot:GHVP01019806.1.p1 GENE.GHVP01019806.1~~GHVP01019806.1.p1  ORF type:complete len:361 (+),score=81.45 GHVP01019806.1:876-1958(+)
MWVKFFSSVVAFSLCSLSKNVPVYELLSEAKPESVDVKSFFEGTEHKTSVLPSWTSESYNQCKLGDIFNAYDAVQTGIKIKLAATDLDKASSQKNYGHEVSLQCGGSGPSESVTYSLGYDSAFLVESKEGRWTDSSKKLADKFLDKVIAASSPILRQNVGAVVSTIKNWLLEAKLRLEYSGLKNVETPPISVLVTSSKGDLTFYTNTDDHSVMIFRRNPESRFVRNLVAASENGQQIVKSSLRRGDMIVMSTGIVGQRLTSAEIEKLATLAISGSESENIEEINEILANSQKALDWDLLQFNEMGNFQTPTHRIAKAILSLAEFYTEKNIPGPSELRKAVEGLSAKPTNSGGVVVCWVNE